MASKETKVEAFVMQVDHVGTSRNGNPTYSITVEGGNVYRTETDGQVGYGATNYRPSHRDGYQPVAVVLTLNGQRRVVRITRRDGSDA